MIMLEMQIKELVEAMKLNTLALSKLSLDLNGADLPTLERTKETLTASAATTPTTSEQVEATATEKPAKKPRRTKKQIAEDKAKEDAAILAEQAVTPPAPGLPSVPVAQSKVMTDLAQGATYDQMVIAGWTDETMLAHGMMVMEDVEIVKSSIPALPTTTMTLDEVRQEIVLLGTKKGGVAVVTAIAKYGKNIDDVAPSNYLALLTELGSYPDQGVPAVPTA